ncbi:SPW repeat protein [Streptomyces sp. 6N223]|uniref:SPW repeat protein n=1 Tax=Streptomyces sp. 6N223 TaxID=3457412 RepID=UPI003FD0CB6B
MTDVSHRRTAERPELVEHPDAMEMRARYDRVLQGRDVVFVDAPVFLAGLYAAISPWVLDFTVGQPELMINNLIVGIAVSVLALGFTMAPERMYGLSWAICAAGIWLVISPWTVGDSPDGGVIVSNVIVGGLLFLLGVASAGASLRARSAMKGAGAEK